MNKEELLEYAKKHYPIGTQYVPVHVDIGINEVVDTDYNYDDGSTEYIHVKSKHIENSFSGCIYKNGEWAKIVSKPEEKIENLYPKKYSLGKIKFKYTKPGDYVPYYYTDGDGILEKLIVHGNTKLHESYKYAEIVNYYKEFYLVKYLDYNNKYVTLGFKEESLEPYVEKVKENPKSLIGRYLKCLKTNSWGNGKTAIGEYLKITDADNYGDFVINNTDAWFSRNRIKNGEYELMPEGFEPEKEVKEEIPEYLECIPSEFSQSYAIIGRIYKFVKTSGKHWGVECNLDCAGYDVGTTLYFYPEQFKPSTKEAYDKQQKILEYPLTEKECFKQEWIPKVGDWVVSLVDREGYRKKGDVFQVLKVSDDCIYYAQNTNGYINTFRPAEPHEIPETITTVNKDDNFIVKRVKINPSEVVEHFEKEIKSEIDSWCIQLTEENRELLLQNKHVFKADWSFDNLKHYYGITKFNVPSYYSGVTHFDKVLTTEEFCKKFNITESYKWVELDFNKLVNTGAIQYKEEEIKIQVKKSKTIKI